MERSQAHMVLEWRIQPGQAGPITAALQTVMLAARRERGCIGCSVATEMSDLVTVRYEEDWDTEVNLRRQVQSDRFGTLAVLVESATEAPRIEFVLPSGSRGLDYAIEVRDLASEEAVPPRDPGPPAARVADRRHGPHVAAFRRR